jgi:hypothetical protein
MTPKQVYQSLIGDGWWWAEWGGYSVGEGIWLGDYSMCKNAYHINYTLRIIFKCPSSRCILYWYFWLTYRAVKQSASFNVRELYDRTCMYDHIASGIYRLRNALLRIAVRLAVMLCGRQQCCRGNRCHRLQVRQLPVPPTVLPDVTFFKFMSQNAATCPGTFSSNVGGEW